MKINIAEEKKSTFLFFLKTVGLMILVSLIIQSCDSIEVEDPNFELNSNTVFTDATTAEAAVTGIYIDMIQDNGFISGGQQSIYALTGLSADEFLNYSQQPEQGQFFSNALLPTNSWNELYIWNAGYDYIYQANAVLEGLASSTGLQNDLIQRLRGEALFIRAFCYFYLVNLYGKVPLAVSTDYKVNRQLEKSDVNQVYRLVENDLLEAITLLPENYNSSLGERIRPNKWAAHSILARMYLFTKVWQKAIDHSSLVIQQESLYSLPEDLNVVFLANSRETIWQLYPVLPNQNTKEGLNFILLSTPFNVSLSNELVDTFELGDFRRRDWIDSITTPDVYYYPTKYKVKMGAPVTEYSMVLRLAEQYLIRAEARAFQGDLIGAAADLSKIRNRAGLSKIEFESTEQALDSIYKERRLELFTEGGHRWIDLKRTERVSEVISPLKPEWQATDILYPIPQNEINNNPNLIQNLGY